LQEYLVPLRFVFPVLALAIALPLTAPAQSPTPQQPEPQPNPGFTLNTDVRIVLTDVTVTDRKGNHVHGLPKSAFHVSIDKQPRPILSFVENASAPTAIAATPVADSNTYSNEFLQHLPPVLNIAVIDISRMGIIGQMQLAIQFKRFLQQLPNDKPLAIYARVGEHMVSFQNFTSDHALLQAAADKIMPGLPVPHDRLSDLQLMYEFAQQLAQIPGHKNVLWFNNGTGLLDSSNPGKSVNSDALRIIFDQLEAARISLYPIDVRGVTFGAALQHMQMDEYAQNTGGHAFYNQNYVDEVAQDALKQDSSFYTLTFSPKNFQPDNKWHKVDITVEPSGYQLSYRQGYFADGNNLAPPMEAKPDRHRSLLLAGGKVVDTPANIRSAPIIFTASIVPASQRASNSDQDSDFTPLHPPTPPKPGRLAYFVRYALPPDVFLAQTVDGHPHVAFEVAALAFNQLGEKVGESGQHVRLTFAHDNPTVPICIEQQIDLRKGDVYLYLAVWDTATGRLGSLQVPITVK
jgi:VWFA-related protein